MRLFSSVPAFALRAGLYFLVAPTSGLPGPPQLQEPRGPSAHPGSPGVLHGSLNFHDGETFIFKYSTPEANERNWIGIYHTTGGPDDEQQHEPSLRWVYAPGKKGSVKIEAPIRASGKYKAYFLADDGYKWLAKSITFTPKSRNKSPQNQLKVLTYNLWNGGVNVKDYHEKQVRFIIDNAVDIIGLQEASGDHAKRLGNALGWNYHQSNPSDTSAILSRHPIVEKHQKVMARSAGATINVDSDRSRQLNFWSIHATAYPYGPYDFCFEGKNNENVTETERVSSRIKEITDVIESTKSQREHKKPFILVGDFNAPSHLDWTRSTKDTHCGAVYEWPTSKIVTDAGLLDSYRVAHPNPRKTPANTWSPIFPYNEDYNKDEPQDRIDFIYHTAKYKVLNSEVKVVGKPTAIPNHANNEWTSDHAAVITTYKIR